MFIGYGAIVPHRDELRVTTTGSGLQGRDAGRSSQLVCAFLAIEPA
jgi:hypothetical protein